MAQAIFQEISKLLDQNTGYKFNSWLNTSASNDIYIAYVAVIGEHTEGSLVKLYSDNLFYALKAFSNYNNELHIKEYKVFLETIIKLQLNDTVKLV
jgi:hypothetical protein